MKKLILLGILASTSAVIAAPKKVASFDRNSWPEKINSQAAFNKASRFEIFNFLKALDAQNLSNKPAVAEFAEVEHVMFTSISQWRKLTDRRLITAFNSACKSPAQEKKIFECKNTTSIKKIKANMEIAYQALDKKFDRWKMLSMAFHHRYLYEKIRLAARFPQVTSEILLLNNDEKTGFNMDDGEFLLTFNDELSSDQDKNISNVEGLIKQLNEANLNGLFFIQGRHLAKINTKKVKEIYKNQCVGSHGYTHKAHPESDKWKESLDTSLDLITSKLGISQNKVWFRPPYGQRSVEMLNHLKQRNTLKVMLWNIDSQSWTKKRTEKEVNDRIITIMLLWRKGIIQFHDTYDNSPKTLKSLSSLANKTAINYINCNTVAEQVK